MNLRIYISVITFFILFQTYAQNHKVVKWINENAIKIEDANPDTDITIFDNSIPKKFADAKLFGFGEATHQGKEFFDIKAKFFKYLVKNQGVNVLISEYNTAVLEQIKLSNTAGENNPRIKLVVKTIQELKQNRLCLHSSFKGSGVLSWFVTLNNCLPPSSPFINCHQWIFLDSLYKLYRISDDLLISEQ